MNDSHFFSIDYDGNLKEVGFCFRNSEGKEILGNPVGTEKNPVDIASLSCRVDREVVRLWQMIRPVIPARGFRLSGQHLTVPTELLSLSDTIQSLKLGVTLPGTTNEAWVRLLTHFDFTSLRDPEHQDVVEKLHDVASELNGLCGGVEIGEESDPEAEVCSKMSLGIALESPGHAKEIMTLVAERIRAAGFSKYWIGVGKAD